MNHFLRSSIAVSAGMFAIYVRARAELQFIRVMFDRIRRLTQNDSRQKIWWRYDSQFIGFLSVTFFLHQKEMLFSPWKKSHFQNTEVQI